MNILHIVPSYKPAYIYGGPIESVARLCEGLAAAGHTVHVFTTTANGTTELDVVPDKTVDVDGVQVTYFRRITKDPTYVSPSLWKSLYQVIDQYEVVHIHSWWNILAMVSARISILRKARVIIAPRGMLSNYIFNSGSSKVKKAMHALFGRNLLKKCYFHATALAEYDECRQLIPGWQGFVLPNIISLPDMPVNHRHNDTFTLVFLSRIHPKKGLELLFEAIAMLDFDVELKIAGDGDPGYIDQLKQLATGLGIQSKIVWLGWMNRQDKFTELMNADLFTLVSMNENFANVVIESLHMGTAVLVSADVALSDFVLTHDMGWVTTLDVNEVAKKLTAAQKDVGKLNRIRSEGRGVIAQNFSEQKLIADYIKQYQKIPVSK